MNATTVSAPGGKIKLFIKSKGDPIPTAFVLMATEKIYKGGKPVALRISGGCKGMSEDDKSQMIEYFRSALAGYSGVIFSGATRSLTKDGKLDPMVTDVPAFIAHDNPNCIAMGTAPRTDVLTLQKDLQLVLDNWGTLPNPGQSAILLIQLNAEDVLDWDGDLDDYFQIMEQWQEEAGFESLGLIAWNGGDITKEEIKRSIEKGWPTILVAGSGRVTDEFIDFFGKAGEVPENVCIVSKDHPNGLRACLMDNNFLD